MAFDKVNAKGELEFSGIRRRLTEGGITAPWATFKPRAGTIDDWKSIKPGTSVSVRGTIKEAIAGEVTDQLTGQQVPWGTATVVVDPPKGAGTATSPKGGIREEEKKFDASIALADVSKAVNKYKGQRVGWIAQRVGSKITAAAISDIYMTPDRHRFIVHRSQDVVIKKTPATEKADNERFNFRRRVIGTISETENGLPVLTDVVIDVP